MTLCIAKVNFIFHGMYCRTLIERNRVGVTRDVIAYKLSVLILSELER